MVDTPTTAAGKRLLDDYAAIAAIEAEAVADFIKSMESDGDDERGEDEPGMCECGMDMDAHAGGMALLHHDETIVAAERARIRREVEALDIETADFTEMVHLAAVLAIVDPA